MSTGDNPKEHIDAIKWISLLPLLSPIDYIVSIDHRSVWRRHLAWAKPYGDKLKEHTTQRFASNMVFMSLILSAEMGVLFSPCDVCTHMRIILRAAAYTDMNFWIGIFLVLSIFHTLLTLIATFTAWAIISSVSDVNARCIIRSSVGLYAAQLPSRTIVLSLYFCVAWLLLFMHVLVPRGWDIAITVLTVTFLLHITSVYSGLGKLMMHTGAMGPTRVLEEEEEEKMLPSELHDALLKIAKEKHKQKLHVSVVYRGSVIDISIDDEDTSGSLRRNEAQDQV